MYPGGARRRLSHLWQLPLLALSVGMFGVSAYLYVDGRPTITVTHKLAQARKLLSDGRPQAAVETIQRLLASEQFEPDAESQIHLALAESLDGAQKLRTDKVPANYRRIIGETQIALGQGARPTGEVHSRLGECYEALEQPVEAVSQYRQAIALDPDRALRLRRKVIDLQIAQSDWAPAEASLDAYLAAIEITDTERAWANSVKAQLLIDRGQFLDARRLLEVSLRLDNDPVAQAEVKFRIGLCFWKLGNPAEGEKFIQSARSQFKGQHPLDAEATYALGCIAQERNDPPRAVSLFDEVLKSHDRSDAATLARLGRAAIRVQLREDDAAIEDFRAVVDEVRARDSLRAPALQGLLRAGDILVARRNYQAAIELLELESSLEPVPQPSYHERLAGACEKRAEQLEQSVPDAGDVEKVRRKQLARDMNVRAGDASLALCRALSAAGDSAYAQALWRSVDLYIRGDRANAAIAALEVFLTERADDALAADVAFRLAAICESTGQDEKAIGAYRRLLGAYPDSTAARKAGLPLAILLSKSPDSLAVARSTLVRLLEDPRTTRDSDDYRSMLFELGRLSCRAGNFADGSNRLHEFVTRFSDDARQVEAVFLLAECNRGLAQGPDPQLASASVLGEDKPSASELNHAEGAKREHLVKAAELYKRCTELIAQVKPTPAADARYQMLSALRYADCQFELKANEEALREYQAVADRWPDDPVGLAALVQVVNVSCALNKLDEARVVNERVRKRLAMMPQGAFAETGVSSGGTVMPPEYWEQWLKWTGANSGLSW